MRKARPIVTKNGENVTTKGSACRLDPGGVRGQRNAGAAKGRLMEMTGYGKH